MKPVYLKRCMTDVGFIDVFFLKADATGRGNSVCSGHDGTYCGAALSFCDLGLNRLLTEDQRTRLKRGEILKIIGLIEG